MGELWKEKLCLIANQIWYTEKKEFTTRPVLIYQSHNCSALIKTMTIYNNFVFTFLKCEFSDNKTVNFMNIRNFANVRQLVKYSPFENNINIM